MWLCSTKKLDQELKDSDMYQSFTAFDNQKKKNQIFCYFLFSNILTFQKFHFLKPKLFDGEGTFFSVSTVPLLFIVTYNLANEKKGTELIIIEKIRGNGNPT